MPRTKRRTAKQSTIDLNMSANMTVNGTMANQPKNIKEIMAEFESEKRNIENHFSLAYDNYRNVVENSFLMLQLTLAGSLKTKLYDYIAEVNLEKPNVPTTTSQGAEKPTRALTKTTSTRSTKQKSGVTSTSKIHTTKVTTKHRNGTLSDDRAQLTDTNESSKFKTPVNRQPLPTLGTVTPKVNMNQPMSMMRRPNQGEVAISMCGSPLMVSSVTRDDMATVSVPMADGTVLSILPRHGDAMDISINEQTKNELLLLKGNIEGLLKMRTK